MPTIVSETPRLIIRGWTVEDIDPYAAIIADPRVMKYIGDGTPRAYEEAVLAINKYSSQVEKQGWSRFALELKTTGELIGFCGFDHYNGELDFGWRLSQAHWNKGFAIEAATEVFRLGIERFHFPRIVCISYNENIASLNVIRKLEIPFEKEIKLNGRCVLQFAHETLQK